MLLCSNNILVYLWINVVHASYHMPQLFNTAITRAREWLIVVGEPVTLCTVGSNRLCWLEFIQKCHKLGTFEYPNANNFETFLETKLITRFDNFVLLCVWWMCGMYVCVCVWCGVCVRGRVEVRKSM